VALSLRLPSPEVIWHRIPIEPGLSSLVYSTKATNQLSGNKVIKQKIPLNQGFLKLFQYICSNYQAFFINNAID